MKIELQILRRENAASRPYWQHIPYDCENEQLTAAYALREINEKHLPDAAGEPVRPVRWECSCMQKKCGACAMRVNGVPALACDNPLKAAPGGVVRLEPLRKFPVVADLTVDRTVMQDNLRAIRLWLTDQAAMGDKAMDAAYEASRCLQCGCCLEVCPNFYAGGSFTGMASAIPFSRLLAELPVSQRKEAAKLYTGRFYNGCGKSLACRNICPAGIDVDDLLVNSNAIAVWKRFGKP